MKLRGREKDCLEALSGTTKSALSLIPGLGQAIAGWDAYKRSCFERNVTEVITQLKDKVATFDTLISGDWIHTVDGQRFARKVFDCAFDTQIEDKQELFVNGLINGIMDEGLSYLEKLKFIDILRSLSLSAVMILADLHRLIEADLNMENKGQRYVNCKIAREIESTSEMPNGVSSVVFDPEEAVKLLGTKYDPHLVQASLDELKSQGVLSDVAGWFRGKGGEVHSRSRYGDRLCYTELTIKFITFITVKASEKTAAEAL